MILIYGKGKVGTAVAELATHLGLTYEIRDDNDGITSFDAYEMIIPSPGVPGTHAIYATGKIVSELDFAYRHMPKGFQIVSITGTDGKSTTSWIMYNILEKEFSVKKGVYLSGNFDVPFSATILDILRKGEKRGYIVLEISSFMSHILREFQSDYSIFTNFRRDHQNWHADMQEYLDAKMHIIARTTRIAVLNQQIEGFAKDTGLSLEIPKNTRIFAQGQDKTIRDRTDGTDITLSGRKKYKLIETPLSGIHNAMNILSVAIVANEMKICSKRMKIYLSEISGLPHRLEKIGEKNGITFVEDSKSTSAQSLEAALGSYAPMNNEQGTMNNVKNLLLIVGGSDKGDMFDYLAPLMRKRVRALVCIGATKDQFIALAEQEHLPYLSTDDLGKGVEWLYMQGRRGDVLMLSPGCASFGLFRDYLDRANQFRECIKKLS